MNMRTVTFTMVGQTPLLYGAPIDPEIEKPQFDGEPSENIEERKWKNRAHVTPNGELYVPAVAVKRSLEFAASWLSETIKGHSNGKATFRKRFVSGVRETTDKFLVRGADGKVLTERDYVRQSLYVPAKADKGGSKRVWRSFPTVNPPWQIEASFYLFDAKITEETFARHVRSAGMFDGIGSMRIGTGGPNGMFSVSNLEFSSVSLDMAVA